MTDTEKFNLLINKLKEFAEAKHCYDVHGDDYSLRGSLSDDVFDDGIEYGEINLARTLLESIGVDFMYPCLNEE